MFKPNGVIHASDGVFEVVDFHCKDCGAHFSKKVLMLPNAIGVKIVACPDCKSHNTERDILIVH